MSEYADELDNGDEFWAADTVAAPAFVVYAALALLAHEERIEIISEDTDARGAGRYHLLEDPWQSDTVSGVMDVEELSPTSSRVEFTLRLSEGSPQSPGSTSGTQPAPDRSHRSAFDFEHAAASLWH